MATKHWVRDVPLTDPQNYIANGNTMQANALLYNFLRVAGWKWLWECDGQLDYTSPDPNHVADGNVQASGLAYWSSYNGGSISKDIVTVHSGIRSLKVIAANVGEGVQSAALLSMKNSSGWISGTGDSLSSPVGREQTYSDNTSRFSIDHIGSYLAISGNIDPNNDGEFVISRYVSTNAAKFENPAGSATGYSDVVPPPPVNTANFEIRPRYEVAIWAATDEAFDVEVDQGDGSFVNVGTIPANSGVFTLYDFFFKRVGTGSSYIRLVSQGAGTIYVGGIHVYSSMWEKPSLIKHGSDGVITNPDKFSSPSFTFDASDVNRVVFVWDPTNNKNSGAYRILSIAAGVATLDLRSGSASLTSQSGLNWRLDTIDYLTYPNTPIPLTYSYAGFGLESPHSTKWRLFLRQSNLVGQVTKGTVLWSAPKDTDFDFGTGTFYMSGPSTQRNRQVSWYKIGGTGQHLWRGGYSFLTSPHDSRFFFMTDEDGAFLNLFLWDEYGAHGCFLIGYISSDFPGVESFYHAVRWENTSIALNECYFDGSTQNFGVALTTFDQAETAIGGCIAQLGIGIVASDLTCVESQSNAGPNPWSGKEWLRPLLLWRDLDMNQAQAAISESDCGIFQTRANRVELTTFDSENFLHLDSGLVWEWSGETIL